MTKKKIIRAGFFVLLMVAVLIGGTSCKFLQQGLSSALQEEQAKQTGNVKLNGSSWCYIGHSGSDMTGVVNHNICIEFDKKSAVSADGVSISFDVTYTNANGNKVTESVSAMNGRFSQDGKAYYVDMSPVLQLFDGATISDGTAIVKMSAYGFVCAEGSQSGRALDKLEKEFSVKPFFNFDPDTEQISFATTESTTGKSISIPINGAIDLSESDVTITPVSGDLPEGFIGAECTVEYDEASGTLLVKPNVDLLSAEAVFKMDITGLRPMLHGTTKDICVYVKTENGDIVSTDSWTGVSGDGAAIYDIASMSVTDDGTNLTVSVKFNGDVALWENDRIGILIANPSVEESATASGDNGIANEVTADGVDYYFEKIAKTAPSDFTVSGTWEQGTSWEWKNGSDSVDFQIPLSSIGSPAVGTELKIFAAVSSYWNGDIIFVRDMIPASAGTTSTTSNANDTLVVDMSQALAYTVK